MSSDELFPSVDTSGQSDIDVKWSQARFGQNPQYKDGDGNMPVVLMVDQLDENGTLREDQVIPIGKGFKVVDNGTRVEHTNPKFNKPGAGVGKGSKAAELLDSLVDIDIDAFRAKLDEGIGPRDAEFWNITFGKPDPETGKQRTYNVPTATAFYGWGADIPDVDGGDVANEARDLNGAGGKTGATEVEVSDDIAAVLGDLAKEHADFGSFVEAAYQLDEIADAEVQAAVDNEAVYQALRG
jgi:hypothetical protein